MHDYQYAYKFTDNQGQTFVLPMFENKNKYYAMDGIVNVSSALNLQNDASICLFNIDNEAGVVYFGDLINFNSTDFGYKTELEMMHSMLRDPEKLTDISRQLLQQFKNKRH
jgi:hypothetical protein